MHPLHFGIALPQLHFSSLSDNFTLFTHFPNLGELQDCCTMMVCHRCGYKGGREEFFRPDTIVSNGTRPTNFGSVSNRWWRCVGGWIPRTSEAFQFPPKLLAGGRKTLKSLKLCGGTTPQTRPRPRASICLIDEVRGRGRNHEMQRE